jgi:hypothetical protein
LHSNSAADRRGRRCRRAPWTTTALRSPAPATPTTTRCERQNTALRAAVVATKRATALRLRDEGQNDDSVLRQIQTQLDLEDVRLARHAGAE